MNKKERSSFTARVGLAQINCTVGDLVGNSNKILERILEAKELGVDIVSFPELALCGYPPEDLLLKPKFIEDNLHKIKELAASVKGMVAVVGFVDSRKGSLYNAAAVINEGKIKGIYHKILLPNYSVFDEKRYFQSGKAYPCFSAGNIVFGVTICEDIWFKDGPAMRLARQGASLIININASPFCIGKLKTREKIVKEQAKTHNVSICYTNLVGGQDELVFDGQSFAVSAAGKQIAGADAFKEQLLVADIPLPKKGRSKNAIIAAPALPEGGKPRLAAAKTQLLTTEEEVYGALRTGLHDYVVKNGFKKVVIGLSGGIDSALVAVLAADALGRENVIGVFMPSRFSSEESRNDAEELAKLLGIRLLTIPIESAFKTYLSTLAPLFEGKPEDITEENLQSRIRGNILMALSNKFNWIVLTTGNKSEMSTGYATLYGDMAGGFAVIKDVPKILVYVLSRYRNSLSPAIPENTISKAPTAELRPNQKDTDSLPPYEILDQILKLYIEEHRSLDEIVSEGFQPELIAKVIRMVDHTEYKRRQAPPGIKITPLAFGKDRRMPITNKYKG
ncbi:MAG: NAD+ synthase [Elusimicrobia bacterium RIFOXYB2_FULL_49_7]|nr:MAG: NAD+ synthase [Elusimicrobia bacterium RIFOXYB2_FULL_49_7]